MITLTQTVIVSFVPTLVEADIDGNIAGDLTLTKGDVLDVRYERHDRLILKELKADPARIALRIASSRLYPSTSQPSRSTKRPEKRPFSSFLNTAGYVNFMKDLRGAAYIAAMCAQ